MRTVLEVADLAVSFGSGKERFGVLRGATFSVGANEVVALVGESGSGKTLTALSVVRLLPANARIERGGILLEGLDVLSAAPEKLQALRGRRVSMIFQEPSSYLNPLFTAGSQVQEALGGAGSREEKRQRALSMFREVGLTESEYFRYPHQLSGGMQQRVMIAMALVNNPPLLLADEPTTALDVTTAMQILELLKTLMARHGTSVLFITHDMSLAGHFSQRMAVMYAGRVVETAPSRQILERPMHPYTRSLIACLPERYHKGERIRAIPGNVPDFRNLPKGCAFHPRCGDRKDICSRFDPAETSVGETRVRCFLYGDSVEN